MIKQESFLGMQLNIQKSINVIHHINRLKKKKHLIVFINRGKHFKIQHLFFHHKNSSNWEYKTLTPHIRQYLQKPTTNIT